MDEIDDIARTFQGTISKAQGLPRMTVPALCICKVIKAYADRNACTITSLNGSTVYNVPVLTVGGLLNDDNVWGEIDLPNEGSYVVVGFMDHKMERPFILGTVIPFGYSKYQSAQVPPNSGSKAYTKKLLESGKEKWYRRIFKSGSTAEVQDDGTAVVETPAGTFIKLKGASQEIDLQGNTNSLTKYGPLNTALQLMLTAINIQLVNAGQPGGITLDISLAEATKVKTE